MKLSTKGRYGLRAMIDLARYSEKEPVSLEAWPQDRKFQNAIWNSLLHF